MGVENRLHQTIAALAPIHGVRCGTPGNSSSCSVVFQPSATAPQIAAANAALAAFDWSAPTQATWEAQQAAANIAGPPVRCKLNADVPNSTNVLANCTGLSFQLAANASYGFQFDGSFTAAAATTGLQLAINGPAASFISACLFVWESAIAHRVLATTAYEAPVLGTASAGATALPFRIWGNLTTTAAGLLVVRFRSEINASAVTIKRGSTGFLFGVP